jgi:4'-phosphopantetheinyl transferase
MSSRPSSPELLKLADDEIHVWVVLDGEVTDPGLLADYERMLEPAERERRARLMSDDLRHQFLLTRSLQRTMLAGYASDVAPRDLRFVAGEQGKPALAAEFAPLGLHFNLAHTRGLVAMAVSREATLGIDAENVAARTAPLPIANRFFTAREAADLAALPPCEQTARFYALWTLKEAWLKATGIGIGAGLGHASFDLASDHRLLRATFTNDEAQSWTFWQAQPTPQHQLAVACRQGTPREMHVKMWRCIPGLPERRSLD